MKCYIKNVNSSHTITHEVNPSDTFRNICNDLYGYHHFVVMKDNVQVGNDEHLVNSLTYDNDEYLEVLQFIPLTDAPDTPDTPDALTSIVDKNSHKLPVTVTYIGEANIDREYIYLNRNISTVNELYEALNDKGLTFAPPCYFGKNEINDANVNSILSHGIFIRNS